MVGYTVLAMGPVVASPKSAYQIAMRNEAHQHYEEHLTGTHTSNNLRVFLFDLATQAHTPCSLFSP